MDPGIVLDLVALGALSFVLLVVDTYFWVRTTLKLRDFNQELQPRLALLDSFAEKLGVGDPLGDGSSSARVAAPSGPPDLRYTKTGRPFLVVNGKARFLSNAQAAAVKRGVSVGAVAPDLIAQISSPDVQGSAPIAPIGSAESAAPDLDYAGMAQILGRPEDEVRAFIAAHSRSGGGLAASPPGGVPPPAPSDPITELLVGLIDGKLDGDKAKAAAREALANLQVQENGGSSAFAGVGGVTW